jgi:O-antigen ligase
VYSHHHATPNLRRVRDTDWPEEDNLFTPKTQNQLRVGRPTLRREAQITLSEVLLCVGPAMSALYKGHVSMAAMLLYGSAAVILGVHALLQQPERYISFAISLIPAILLMRNHFLYSSLIAIFGAGLLLWWALRPEEVWTLFGSGVRLWFVLICIFYWGMSWLNTGNFYSNMHAVEFFLIASCVFLLGGHRGSLAAGLLGMGLTVFCVGIGVFPYGERLGLVKIGSITLGNPVTLGLSAALVFLLCVAEGGRWLGLESHPTVRFLISFGSAAMLMLSTSRGSWLMTMVGALTILAFGKTYRRNAWRIVVLVPTVALFVALSTGRGGSVIKFYSKVASSDTSLSKKTTGRFDQWARLPTVFANSPIWGHGGGSGASIYHEFGGKELQWHSLYLQLLVETGAVGFLVFGVILLAIGNRAREHLRATGEVVPLIAVLCYLTIGLSISAIDGISGVYLGLALVAGNSQGFWRVTVVRLREQEDLKSAPVSASWSA